MLLNPNQIQNVMREVLAPRPNETESLDELLESSNLGKRDVLDTIGSLMRGADTSAVRLSSAKLAAQLHGLVDKDERVNVPSVTIIINDSQFSVNPILIPR